MRIIVIGAVAAGTSAAAKARRNTEEAEIIIYEKDRDISYSGCGMPYFLGGEVSSAKELTPRDSVFFKRFTIFPEAIKLTGNGLRSINPKNNGGRPILLFHSNRPRNTNVS